MPCKIVLDTAKKKNIYYIFHELREQRDKKVSFFSKKKHGKACLTPSGRLKKEKQKQPSFF